jgi:hypothetical protein
MCELDREAVTGDCRNMNIEVFHDVHTTPNTVRVIESRGMRWEGVGVLKVHDHPF